MRLNREIQLRKWYERISNYRISNPLEWNILKIKNVELLKDNSISYCNIKLKIELEKLSKLDNIIIIDDRDNIYLSSPVESHSGIMGKISSIDTIDWFIDNVRGIQYHPYKNPDIYSFDKIITNKIKILLKLKILKKDRSARTAINTTPYMWLKVMI